MSDDHVARNRAHWDRVAASATGQVYLGLPCVLGGAATTAALKYMTPE